MFPSFACSDAENLFDAQIPFLPPVELSVKALVVVAPAVLAATPSACVQLFCCSHHPFLVCASKRNAVWKVIFRPLICEH